MNNEQLYNGWRELKYNGWTNYETWATNLHLSELFDSLADENKGLERYELSQLFAESVADLFADDVEGLPSLLRDLLRLDKVDFYDIAEHYVRAEQG